MQEAVQTARRLVQQLQNHVSASAQLEAASELAITTFCKEVSPLPGTLWNDVDTKVTIGAPFGGGASGAEESKGGITCSFRDAVVLAGGLPVLCRLLGQVKDPIVGPAAWALANVINHNFQHRNVVMGSEGYRTLVKHCKDIVDSQKAVRERCIVLDSTAAHFGGVSEAKHVVLDKTVLSCIVRLFYVVWSSHPTTNFHYAPDAQTMLQTLSDLLCRVDVLENDDECFLMYTCGTLTYLSRAHPSPTLTYVTLCRRVALLLSHRNSILRHLALMILSYLTFANGAQMVTTFRGMIRDIRLLISLKEIFELDPRPNVRTNVYWLTWGLVSSEQLLPYVIQSGLLVILFRNFQLSMETKILSSTARNTILHIGITTNITWRRHLIDQGIFPAMCLLLRSKDVPVVSRAILAIEHMFESATTPELQACWSQEIAQLGGVECLQALARNLNPQISHAAAFILSTCLSKDVMSLEHLQLQSVAA